MKSLWRLVLSVLLLAGCNGDKDTAIRIIGEDSANLKALQAIAESYPDAKIVFEAESFEDLLDKSNQDLALGTGQYDIIMQYNFTLASYVENDLVWKISDLKKEYPDVDTTFEKGLFENAWKEVGWYYDDKNQSQNGSSPFGYPFASNTLLLAVNQKLFDDNKNRLSFRNTFGRELSVPETWVQYREVAEFFGTQPGVSGVAMQGAASGWLYYEWAAVMSSQGLQVFPNKKYGWERGVDLESSVSRPELLEATREYFALKPYNTGNFESVDAAVQIETLAMGQTAMGIVWSDFAPSLLESASTDFTLHPMPGTASPLAGGAFYINKKTRHAEEAFKFISWLMQPDQQTQLLRNNLGSPSSLAYTKQVLQESQFARAMQMSMARGAYAFEANKDSELVNNTLTSALQRGWRKPAELPNLLRDADRDINRERANIFAQ